MTIERVAILVLVVVVIYLLVVVTQMRDSFERQTKTLNRLRRTVGQLTLENAQTHAAFVAELQNERPRQEQVNFNIPSSR